MRDPEKGRKMANIGQPQRTYEVEPLVEPVPDPNHFEAPVETPEEEPTRERIHQ